jgi:hypothetical protein
MLAVRLPAREPMMKILMVLTSHDRLGDTGRKTCLWLEEPVAPTVVADFIANAAAYLYIA